MSDLINGRTPEEIKKGLWQCLQPAGLSCVGCPYNGTCLKHPPEVDALDLITHLEAAQPKWISVKERLPEDGKLVLVTMDGTINDCKTFIGAYELAMHWSAGVDEEGIYHSESWELWDYKDGHVENIKVFYWMPLPEPPKRVPDR